MRPLNLQASAEVDFVMMVLGQWQVPWLSFLSALSVLRGEAHTALILQMSPLERGTWSLFRLWLFLPPHQTALVGNFLCTNLHSQCFRSSLWYIIPTQRKNSSVRDCFKCFIYCPVLIYISVVSPTAVCVFLFSNALVDGFAFISSYLPTTNFVNLCLLNQMSKTGVHGGLPGNNLQPKFRVFSPLKFSLDKE